ncbi:membrane protein insertion efficiency factor YidD [Streptomyces purpureus]|uniref:membrane protein insertion efficiency factor YidD n=1 Tax=Streptomyces purpureus TaxID=1951 RepID=UPI0037A5A3E3
MAKSSRNNRHKSRPDGPPEQKEGFCENACDLTLHPCCCGGVWAQSALLLPLFRTSASLVRGDDPAAPRPSGRVASAMYRSVRRYRVAISPTRPACCPYTPSCSTYAVKALHRHGALRGGGLILARLLRCRPAAARRRGFHDPVPPRA